MVQGSEIPLFTLFVTTEELYWLLELSAPQVKASQRVCKKQI